METKRWTLDDLAAITGRARQTISSIIAGTSAITLDTALVLAAVFGNTAKEWLEWDDLYRLSVADKDVSHLEKLSRFYQLAPIREMQKRDWIRPTSDPGELEAELKKFFGTDSLDGELSFPIATRRTVRLPDLNPAEKAWCYRARQLASSFAVESSFNPKRLDQAERKLRQLTAYVREARHIPSVLSEYGIRFVVIEPLSTVRIDGAAFWMDTEPVIALSLRHDRIDGFWFTLMHEFAHVKNGDASVDPDLIDGTKGIAVSLTDDESEKRANEEATASLIPPDELKSFIGRVGPLYARTRIIQFAHRMKIHPGIIVGQLQHRNEIGYSSLRDMLVKIRDTVTSTALTDGWNQTIAPNAI